MRSRGLRAASLLASVAVVGLLAGLAQAKPLAGVVRDLGGRAGASVDRAGAREAGTARERRAHLAVLGSARRLPYEGGPVLHWNRTHLIFWQPADSGLRFDAGYESLIERFLRNVAAASHTTGNVYGLTGQYTDWRGPAAYASTYGGAVVASNRLPVSYCHEPPTGPGWSVCLTDEQLQREIERVVSKDHLSDRPNDVYFLVTPQGLGDCEYYGPDNCALGGGSTGYCGYHSQTDNGRILYAVIPYNAMPGHCQSNNPRPNHNTADPAISTISHEQSEMVTDPLGNAWVDPNSGEEDGDLCLTSFGPTVGGSGASAWNEVIGGGHYYLQEEWSDYNGGCQSRAKPDWLVGRVKLRSTRPLSVWLRGRAAAGQGRIVSYRWFFGRGHAAAGRLVSHRYRRTGNYRAVLRATDSWDNWTFYAVSFSLSRAGKRVVLATNAG